MATEDNNDLLDTCTDLLSEMAYSTITSFANMLASSVFALNPDQVNLDDDGFQDSFMRLSVYLVSLLVLQKDIPTMLIEESKLITKRCEKLMNTTLEIFREPEKFISEENPEHDLLVEAVLQARFRSYLEDISCGILDGDMSYYETNEDDEDTTYDLYEKDDISHLSDESLREELMDYYEEEIGLFSPEEEEEMIDHLNA